MYQYWKQKLDHYAPLSYTDANKRDEFYAWRGILLTPMWMEHGDVLYMMRVVTEKQGKKTGREGDSHANRPLLFQCQGQTYFGLVDEALFFLPGITKDLPLPKGK